MKRIAQNPFAFVPEECHPNTRLNHMSDLEALRQFRSAAHFSKWNGSVSSDDVEASEESIRTLLDDLIVLGAKAPKGGVRSAFYACVERFNELNDRGWIGITESDAICDLLERIADATGFEEAIEWIDDKRDW